MNNTKTRKRFNRKETLTWYSFIAIPIIGFLVFTLYPIIWVMIKSAYYYTGSDATQVNVGLQNFVDLFTGDVAYWSSWKVTIKFALCKLPFELPIAMIIAVLLNKKMKGAGFFRSLYYLPNVISVAVIGIIFSNMFDYFGFVNGFLYENGIISEKINWFANETTALSTLIIASIWSSFGVNVLYFLAAMQNIPEDLYESAKLEGAGRFTTFFKITLPMMAPVLQTILLLSINGTLHINDLILVTTNGAPAGKTYSVMAYVVSKFIPGFVTETVNIGYGCATALVTSAIFILIGVGYSKLTKKMSEIY